MKKSAIEMRKRALSLGVMLILMAATVLLFNGDVVRFSSSLIVTLSAIVLSAFVVFLVWPIIKEADQIITRHENAESSKMMNRKSIFIKISKRSSILIFVWIFLVGVDQITNGVKWMVNTSLIIILSGLALTAFIFFLVWPAFNDVEKMIDQDEYNEMFP